LPTRRRQENRPSWRITSAGHVTFIGSCCTPPSYTVNTVALKVRAAPPLSSGMNAPILEDAGAVAASGKPPATGAAAWLVIALWLLGTAGAFWFFEVGSEPFRGTTAQSFALPNRGPVEAWYREHVASSSVPATRLTVVRLHAPHCGCDRDSASTARNVETDFQRRGVRFLDMADGRLRAAGATAAPAALVFDAAGRLIYYGPSANSSWGSSNWCGSGSGLIESVLERALQGGMHFATTPVTRGCFCTG
jgi:hypothetical protein